MVIASENARRIYGLKGTSWTINEIRQISLPEYRVMLEQAFADLISGRKDYDVEFKIHRACDNKIIDIHSAAEYDPVNRRIFGIIHDITKQKKAQEDLQRSEEKYRLLFNSINDAIYFHEDADDGRGQFTEVNDSASKMLEYSRNELLKMSPKDIDEPGSLLSETTAGQPPKSTDSIFERVHITKDGKHLPVEINSSTVILNGNPMHLSVVRDISERKAIEKALSESEQRYRLLAENSQDVIWTLTLDGRFTYVSPSVFQLRGFTPAEVMNQTLQEAVCAGSIITVTEGLKNLSLDPVTTEKESQRLFEIEQPCKDGSTVWTEANISLIWDAGQPSHILGVSREISYRKRMEDQLLHAAEEWRATFDAIETPLSIQDRNYKILRVNKAFAAAMKLPPEELIGKTCFEVSHGTGEPILSCPHRLTLETGIAAQVEIHDPVAGTYSLVSTYPMFGPNREIIASVHISQDITERKHLQEQLMITNRLASVGELAAGIAHEINNPLTGVLGFSELVLSAEISPAVREDVKVIHSEAQRAADIVRNLLTFARRHSQVREPLNVNEVIQRVMTLRAYDQRLNNITTISSLDPEVPEINADFFQLQQVFLNIVLNAEHFMIKNQNSGELRISSTWLPETKKVRIEFIDNGTGIKPENLSRLFDPFFTTKEVGQGTGLGLSMSHGIISQHGGKLWAESESGHGATFIVELPVNQPSMTET